MIVRREADDGEVDDSITRTPDGCGIEQSSAGRLLATHSRRKDQPSAAGPLRRSMLQRTASLSVAERRNSSRGV